MTGFRELVSRENVSLSGKDLGKLEEVPFVGDIKKSFSGADSVQWGYAHDWLERDILLPNSLLAISKVIASEGRHADPIQQRDDVLDELMRGYAFFCEGERMAKRNQYNPDIKRLGLSPAKTFNILDLRNRSDAGDKVKFIPDFLLFIVGHGKAYLINTCLTTPTPNPDHYLSENQDILEYLKSPEYMKNLFQDYGRERLFDLINMISDAGVELTRSLGIGRSHDLKLFLPSPREFIFPRLVGEDIFAVWLRLKRRTLLNIAETILSVHGVELPLSEYKQRLAAMKGGTSLPSSEV